MESIHAFPHRFVRLLWRREQHRRIDDLCGVVCRVACKLGGAVVVPEGISLAAAVVTGTVVAILDGWLFLFRCKR